MKKKDISSFVQKPYLKNNYIESNTEGIIDMKNQFKIKNLPRLVESTDANCKSYLNCGLGHPSILTNYALIDFDYRSLYNVCFVEVSSLTAFRGHLTPKMYVNFATSTSVHETSLLRLDPDENLKLDEQDSIILNSTLTSPRMIREMPTKSLVDVLSENDRNKRKMSTAFNDRVIGFDDNKSTNWHIITVKRHTTSDNELSKKVGDLIGEDSILRFIETQQNYIKVTVGNTDYNLTKLDTEQTEDTTNPKTRNGGDFFYLDGKQNVKHQIISEEENQAHPLQRLEDWAYIH